MARATEPRTGSRFDTGDGCVAPEFYQHRKALVACAQRVLHDEIEAVDVADEVLAVAEHAIALFRPTGSLGSWLQGLAIGMALARLRADLDGERRGEKHAAPRPVGRSAVVRSQKLANG